jgi:hypothetical protein
VPFLTAALGYEEGEDAGVLRRGTINAYPRELSNELFIRRFADDRPKY